MRVLIVGAGGVGSATALILARRGFADRVVVADYSLERARAVVDRIDEPAFVAAQVDEGALTLANDPIVYLSLIHI